MNNNDIKDQELLYLKTYAEVFYEVKKSINERREKRQRVLNYYSGKNDAPEVIDRYELLQLYQCYYLNLKQTEAVI